jgi:hypothetical protein
MAEALEQLFGLEADAVGDDDAGGFGLQLCRTLLLIY